MTTRGAVTRPVADRNVGGARDCADRRHRSLRARKPRRVRIPLEWTRLREPNQPSPDPVHGSPGSPSVVHAARNQGSRQDCYTMHLGDNWLRLRPHGPSFTTITAVRRRLFLGPPRWSRTVGASSPPPSLTHQGSLRAGLLPLPWQHRPRTPQTLVVSQRRLRALPS